MRADLHDEHVLDVQLRGNAEQHGGRADAVGVGQFGEIAGTHQHLDLGALAPEPRITLERAHETEIDGIEHGIGEIFAALGVERIHGAVERGHVAVVLGDQHRHGVDLIGDLKGRPRSG